MGSLALSRVEAADQPAPTIADEVARIARQELAPLASEIDAGSVYPAELLRGLGKVGAWSATAASLIPGYPGSFAVAVEVARRAPYCVR